ncbi:MAG: hypothetical protein H7Y33_17070 [Cytophagales bacterium]|nr:hypothetical protein [Rhizobacter sp.]
MIEHGHRLHLLRDGELIDAVITQAPTHTSELADGCAMELAWRGRKLKAYGTDAQDAMVALRGALAVDGLYLNIARAPLRA